MRRIYFEQITNARDLGGIPTANGRTVKQGLMFRSAAINNASGNDAARLTDEFGVKKIIDLRIGYERIAKPDVEITGITNLHIPFYDNDIVGIEYFKPVPGTITIGKDFACDPDDFYRDMANELTARQIKEITHTIFDSALNGDAVFYHCSGGKDRAGITSLVLLEILGCTEEEILRDYLLTNESRGEQVDKIYQRFLRLCQGDEAMAKDITDNHCARPANLIAFREAVDANYGSMDAFIHDVLGYTDEEIARLRAELTE